MKAHSEHWVVPTFTLCQCDISLRLAKVILGRHFVDPKEGGVDPPHGQCRRVAVRRGLNREGRAILHCETVDWVVGFLIHSVYCFIIS